MAEKAKIFVKSDFFLLAGENNTGLVLLLAVGNEPVHQGFGNSLMLKVWEYCQTKDCLPGICILVGAARRVKRIAQTGGCGTAAVDEADYLIVCLSNKK